jgi:malonyl-CoA decarboxylase
MLLRLGDPDFKPDWLQFLTQDPVHPQIPVEDRLQDGRTVFALTGGGNPEAMVCAKLTDHMSRTINEILSPGQQELVAMFYTVFRLPGAAGGVGADIINEAINYCRQQGVKQLYTLSPIPSLRKNFAEMPTEDEIREYLEAKKDPVARFHLGNGAKLHSINFNADNSAKRMDESWGIMVNYNYTNRN